MDDKQIEDALAEVGAAWLMDEEDEMCQANAIRHIVAAAVAAERERCAGIVRNAAAHHGLCCSDCDALADLVAGLGA